MTPTLQDEKKALNQARDSIFSDLTRTSSPHKVVACLAQWTDVIDEQVKTRWQAAQISALYSLVAVGGYGRRDLFPYSDVDLLILTPDVISDIEQGQISDFVQSLWDVGMEVGHSVRTVNQCLSAAMEDITVQTNLLEHRYLIGDKKRFAHLRDRLRAQLYAPDFFRAKLTEMRHRHGKFEDSPYQLEPNCKEAPGGLRDLHVVLWIAQAAGFGSDWVTLAERNLITEEEARQVYKKAHFLRLIRIHLHRQAQRCENRLLFDLQPKLAQRLGFVDDLEIVGVRRSSEVLMQHYFWATKAIVQISEILLQNLEDDLFQQEQEQKVLNPRFVQKGDLIDIAHDQLFVQTPSAMLEIFLVMAQHPDITGMAVRARRSLWHQRFSIDTAFCRAPENRALFLAILQSEQGITHALRRMNQTSILGRYLPEFRAIVGQMQHDLFHIYTVDQHIMMVVRNVRRFTMAKHAHEFPLCSEVMSKLEKPWLLYIAALYHDIAKGRGGDHSQLGMVDARKFCVRHGLANQDTALVVFLVQHHLTLSTYAQKRDLSDPDTVSEFAAIVGQESYLDALYLLTVADIRGTSPKVWNFWKARLLEELYRATLNTLRGEGKSGHSQIVDKRTSAMALIPQELHEVTTIFWQQLNVAYFMQHPVEVIAWHAQKLAFLWSAQRQKLESKLETEAETNLSKISIRQLDQGIQVMVFVKDITDLFARISLAFDRANWSVLDARIQTTDKAYALDTFLVLPQLPLSDPVDQIEAQLLRQIIAPTPLPLPILGKLSRQSRVFPIAPRIEIQIDSKGEHALLNVIANDRNGLLYALAHSLHEFELNLLSARVATLGERVEDIFLISGGTLNNVNRMRQFEQYLLNLLSVK